jgi:excinuclease ABC subunit C
MCPGVCTGEVNQKEYAKIIKNIILFFEGKKKIIEKNLLKDMKDLARKKQFEKAQEIKEKIYSLNHIRDVTLIKRDVFMDRDDSRSSFRVEAYDIAHFAGKETVGVMTVVENGEVNKDQYRKFKIKGFGKVKIDDVGNLRELLSRRLGHPEWQLPDLIVIDGGTAQMNVAKNLLKENGLNIEIVSVVKDDRHKPKDFIGDKETIEKYKNEILLANSESHRFAIQFHRKRLRGRVKRGF